METIDIVIERITVRKGLSILNFQITEHASERLFAMYSSIHRMEKYITTNESAGEISILVETTCKPIVLKH